MSWFPGLPDFKYSAPLVHWHPSDRVSQFLFWKIACLTGNGERGGNSSFIPVWKLGMGGRGEAGDLQRWSRPCAKISAPRGEVNGTQSGVTGTHLAPSTHSIPVLSHIRRSDLISALPHRLNGEGPRANAKAVCHRYVKSRSKQLGSAWPILGSRDTDVSCSEGERKRETPGPQHCYSLFCQPHPQRYLPSDHRPSL